MKTIICYNLLIQNMYKYNNKCITIFFQKNSVKALNESIKQVGKNVYSRNSKGETKLHSACAKVIIKFIKFPSNFFYYF